MKKMTAVLLLVLFASFFGGPVFADCGGSRCPVHGKMSAGDDKDSSPCPITAKFMKKAKFILSNGGQIGLTEDQIRTIQALKLDVEKTAIRQGAEMQIFGLEVTSKLYEEKVDAEAVKAMIDKASLSMTDGAKSIVDAYVKLKATLTPEQVVKLKEIWMKK